MLAVLLTPLSTNLMALRGGMAVGPLDADMSANLLKVAAATTVASAVASKYGGFGSTSLGDFFSGDVWTTNVVVAMVTGLASTVLYTMGESGFDTTQLTAALWLGSLALKLKDNASVDTLKDNKEETIIAAVLALNTFMD
jgi:hypothetical protein|tara:strand:+ start:156 stop:575 length:420 start_codon:yes stop_codon:yes gene_type:complete